MYTKENKLNKKERTCKYIYMVPITNDAFVSKITTY